MTDLPVTRWACKEMMRITDNALSELQAAVADGEVDDTVVEELQWQYDYLENLLEGTE